jgi:hypothetical protein
MIMLTEKITVSRHDAEILYRKYKQHAAYNEPIDWEVQRTYDLLRRGKVIIKALESIKAAGLNREFLPKLALAPAVATKCHLIRRLDGSITMSPHDRWSRRSRHILNLRENTFVFPADSFPVLNWGNRATRQTMGEHEATVPIIPTHIRPKRGLANYHVLWEAEWQRVPPRDPYLLRRIGKADLWLVVAHWDLTEVERAALSTRI